MGNLIDTDGLALYDEEYVQPFIDDTQKMIAPVEDEATASQPYAVGDQIIHNDFLYKVTQAIAHGGTLNPASGGNIELADKIVEQLKSLFDGEGDLSALTTTAKSSLVDAINEIVNNGAICKWIGYENTSLNNIVGTSNGIRYYSYRGGDAYAAPSNYGGYLIDMTRSVGDTTLDAVQIAIDNSASSNIFIRTSGNSKSWPTISPYGWNQIYGKTIQNGTVISGLTSIASSTYRNIASISVEKGTWLFTGSIRYALNSTGVRGISIHPTSQWNGSENVTDAISGERTIMNHTKMMEFNSATTVYLIGYQNSGSTLAVDAIKLQAYKLT